MYTTIFEAIETEPHEPESADPGQPQGFYPCVRDTLCLEWAGLMRSLVTLHTVQQGEKSHCTSHLFCDVSAPLVIAWSLG